MSAPNFPNITPVISIDRDSAINLLLSSIAMEELGLIHILNAEGEKIQYTLGRGSVPPTIDQMLEMNESLVRTLNAAIKTEMHLQNKLESVIGLLASGRRSVQSPAAASPGRAPAWTAAHAFAASTTGQTVAIETTGTALRFPDNQVLSGVMRNASSTVFTVTVSGHYLVAWTVNVELAASDFIALTINNVIYAPAMLTGTGAAGYTSTVIVPLGAGSHLSVKMFGRSRETHLFDGAGATLTILRVK